MDQRDIVLVPFPFTDLSSVKTRPALIISNKNLKGSDVVLCGITSKKSGHQEIVLTNRDLELGQIPVESFIKYGKIVSLEKNIIKKIVAKISKPKFKEVSENLTRIIN